MVDLLESGLYGVKGKDSTTDTGVCEVSRHI